MYATAFTEFERLGFMAEELPGRMCAGDFASAPSHVSANKQIILRLYLHAF